MSDISDFINSGSGGAPAFKFVNKGDKIMGTVIRREVVESTELNDKTKVVKNLTIQIRSDEEHTLPVRDKVTGAPVMVTGREWTVWVKPNSQMLSALGLALQAGNAPKGAPLPGDRIAFEFTDTEPSKTVGFNDKKVYAVVYKHVPQTATVGTAASGVSIDDL